MQTVSTSWKENQKRAFVSESQVEVSMDITDPDATADASSTDNGSVYISDTAQVVSEVDESIVPYSTLEKNLWILDGKREIIPVSNVGDYGDCGYIGNTLSNDTCDYAGTYPYVRISFSQVHRNLIPGITITWSRTYNEYADSFIVIAYKGSTIVANQTIRGNKDIKSVVTMDIVDYDSIRIFITKWCLPHRRARIEKVFLGINKVYAKRNLFTYTHTMTVDPVSTSLPKAEVSFSIDNVDNSYNPNNINGLSKYLRERQEIKTRYGYNLGGKSEWIDGGTFYLSEWNASQNSIMADFKARDLLEFMSATYYEGLYNPSGTSLYDLALSVLQKADLPLNKDGTVKWVLDESLKGIRTVAPLPVDTLANNLQLIANAGECVMYQDRQGTLHVERVGNNVTDYTISLTNSYAKSELSLSKPLKEVKVVTHNIFAGDNSEIYNGVLSINGTVEVVLTYYEMAKNAVATVTGGTLVSAEYYSNACKLTISGAGDVSISIMGTVIKESKTDVITNSGLTGETITVTNPLITSQERAKSVGAWMESYLKNRTTLISTWRPDPRLDATDIVTNQNEYKSDNVRMTKVSYSYSGAFRATGEGRVI